MLLTADSQRFDPVDPTGLAELKKQGKLQSVLKEAGAMYQYENGRPVGPL